MRFELAMPASDRDVDGADELNAGYSRDRAVRDPATDDVRPLVQYLEDLRRVTSPA